MSFGVGEQFVNSQIADRKLEETRKAAAPKTNIDIFATKDTNKDKSLDISEHKLIVDDFQLGSQEFITSPIIEKATQILTNLLKTLKIEYTPKTVEVPVSDGNSDEVDVNSLAIVNNARKELDKDVENLINNRKNQVLQELKSRIDGSVSAKRSTIIDWSPASKVDLGTDWRGNRYKGDDLAKLKEAVSTMEQPSDLLEYYLEQHSKELGGKTSIRDYKPELMQAFIDKNPSIIRDDAIASNAKLDKLDFPSIALLKSLKADAPQVVRVSNDEAKRIGKEIFSIVDDNEGDASAKGLRNYIEVNIDADNVAEVWANYHDSQNWNEHALYDNTILNSFTSEWLGYGEGKGRSDAFEATKHIINSLKVRAAALPQQTEAVTSALDVINTRLGATEGKVDNWINNKGGLASHELVSDSTYDSALSSLFNQPITDLVDAILAAEKPVEPEGEGAGNSVVIEEEEVDYDQ